MTRHTMYDAPSDRDYYAADDSEPPCMGCGARDGEACAEWCETRSAVEMEPMKPIQHFGFRPHRPRPEPWIPLRRGDDLADGMEYWSNPRYDVSRRYEEHNGETVIVIGITRSNQSAERDWRDFQEIKNQLAGPEWEGVELYPAESRKKDPSNRFYLFCWPHRLPFGLPGGRIVMTPEEAIAPQRRFI